MDMERLCDALADVRPRNGSTYAVVNVQTYRLWIQSDLSRCLVQTMAALQHVAEQTCSRHLIWCQRKDNESKLVCFV